MKTVYQLKDFEPCPQPISLTIGNFDGVHRGHQAILSNLCDRKVVFTFSNHPIEILNNQLFYRLTTTAHRLQLLKKCGVHTTIMVPFTESFSKQSAEEFILNLHSTVPFTSLVLGHDAVIGHKRQGNFESLLPLSKQLGFTLEYIEPLLHEKKPISSSLIRKHIQEGCFKKANALLGRPYSIMTTVEPGSQHGRLLGFQTANLKVHSLCLPPLGVYVITTTIKDKEYLGVANLGHAPTLHANRPPILEVHLIDYSGELYNQQLDVIFHKFLRNEKRFESIEMLKLQIQKDIDSALSYRKEATD